MDFEFQNGTGPLDARSPFAQLSKNAQRLPQGINSPSKKRPYSAFDSPTKPRTMGSQQSSPQKPLPAPPSWSNNLFSTPRKPRDDYEDSSAGETPRSPEQNNDSDATPDTMSPRRSGSRSDDMNAYAVAGAERERASPVKERPTTSRRESLFGTITTKMKKMYSPGEDTTISVNSDTDTDCETAGRRELSRPEHLGGIEKRASKRRRRDVDRRVARQRRHSVSDSGEDNDQPPTSPRKTSGHQPGMDENKPHWMSNVFTFIAQHPTVPHILSFYAQLAFNVFLLGAMGYLIYCFWSAVAGDVDERSWEVSTEIMAEMATCAKEYTKNRCSDEQSRVPAMDTVCANWYMCMNRDPKKVGRAKVSARTFAEIFNSFVEEISYKAMFFTVVLVFGCFAISNLVSKVGGQSDETHADTAQAFGFFRNKTQEYQPAYGYGYAAPPPPTPQRTFSGQDGGFYAGTPWHQQQGVGFEPQPSGGYGQIDGRNSPVKRLTYN